MINVGERLKEIRLMFGYTISDVSKSLHCSYWQYRRYENNESKIPFETILLLCDVYNVSTEYFAGSNENIIKDTLSENELVRLVMTKMSIGHSQNVGSNFPASTEK